MAAVVAVVVMDASLAARTMLTSDDLPTFERPTKATSGSGEVGSVSSETPPLTKSTLCTSALMSA